MKKTTKTTVETVKTVNILEEENATATEAQAQNSLYLELGEKPQMVAVVGCAIWQKPFNAGTDLVLGLKVVPHDDPDAVKIVTIRAFKKLNQKTGKMAASSFAYKHATGICRDAGAVITEIGGPDTKPNLKDFRWTAIQTTVVTIGSRLWEGRYYPNSVVKYVPPQAPASGNFLDEDEDSVEVEA